MRLLDFLSKTDSVDLYNFPMYENKISYSEYKIKAICEDPFVKNKFDDRVKIDLKENIVYLDYEFSENIIKPIINNKFLYSDPLKRICFLFVEFKRQENSEIFNKYFEEIIDNFDSLKQDCNLFVSEKINEENISHLNLKYIFECVEDYIDLLKEHNKNLLKDNLLIKILQLIQNNIDESFQYVEDDLLTFIQKFKELKNVDEPNMIKIIDKLLSNNFEKYYKELDWYLKFSSSAGKTCFVGNIIKLIENNIELDEELIEEYLNNRYFSINTNNYFDNVSNNIAYILAEPSIYKCILSPLYNNLNSKDISFEKLENVINNTKYISSNEDINKLILRIVLEMKKSIGFDETKYKLILTNIDTEYEKSESISNQFKEFLEECNDDDKYILLGYNEETKIFNNFKVLKNYKLSFVNKDSLLFNILCNSYCKFEDFVVKTDLERHGLKLSSLKNEIKNIIKENIDNTIYLINDFSEEEINDIDFQLLNINEIELEYIENKYLLTKIVNQLKMNIDNNIRNIKSNKENKELIKEEVDKLLLNANKLYAEIKYSDKTLWTKLKIINEYLALNELIDTYYIPKLKEYPNLIKLFSEGRYKDNYMKDNIFADKILIGIGIKNE